MAGRSVVRVVQPAVAALAGFYLSMLFSMAVWALAPLMLGWQPTVVMSGSMEPTVKAGDILVAAPVSPEDIGSIKPSMVLLAVNPLAKETLFTHRVVSILPDGRIITKGDNNGSLDPEPLPAANIRGIEKLRVPAIGLPIEAVHTGNPLPLAIFVVVTTLAAVSVLDDEKRTAAAKAAEDASENDDGGAEEDAGNDAGEPGSTDVGAGSEPGRRHRSRSRPRRTRIRPRTPAKKVRDSHVYATRREARQARQRELGSVARTAVCATTVIALGAGLLTGVSTAAFTATTKSSSSSWAASASFGGGGSNVTSCNGAVYTVSVAAATITCTIVSPGTGSVTHDLSIKGTGANVKWTVTADWSGVAKFKNATLTNYGYTATTGIPGPTYVLTPLNLCTGGPPPPDVATSTCNFTWIGSALATRTPRFIVYLNP